MIKKIIFLIPYLLSSVALSAVYPDPPPTFEASKYTTWDELTVKGSSKAKINVEFTGADGSPDSISMTQLDLVGDDYQRGYAHGYLLAHGISYFNLNFPF